MYLYLFKNIFLIGLINFYSLGINSGGTVVTGGRQILFDVGAVIMDVVVFDEAENCA